MATCKSMHVLFLDVGQVSSGRTVIHGRNCDTVLLKHSADVDSAAKRLRNVSSMKLRSSSKNSPSPRQIVNRFARSIFYTRRSAIFYVPSPLAAGLYPCVVLLPIELHEQTVRNQV